MKDKPHMKKLLLLIFLMLFGSAYANTSDVANDAESELKKALNECTKITSSLDRLNCFDKVARTPITVPSGSSERPNPFPVAQRLQIIELVKENEAQRQKGDMIFLKSETAEFDTDGKEIGTQVIISAPGRAIDPDKPRIYLTISCILNISRLQIISPNPVSRQSIRVQLLVDDKPIGRETVWQVLESGQVVDAGRGLVAIDLLKRLGQGRSLTIMSDYEELNNIHFDAAGLNDHIQRERQACHW